MGIIFIEFGDYINVIKFLMESFIVVIDFDDKVVIVQFNGGLGVVYYKIRYYLLFIFYSEKYLILVREVNWKKSQVVVFGNFGNVYLLKGDYIKVFIFY